MLLLYSNGNNDYIFRSLKGHRLLLQFYFTSWFGSAVVSGSLPVSLFYVSSGPEQAMIHRGWADVRPSKITMFSQSLPLKIVLPLIAWPLVIITLAYLKSWIRNCTEHHFRRMFFCFNAHYHLILLLGSFSNGNFHHGLASHFQCILVTSDWGFESIIFYLDFYHIYRLCVYCKFYFSHTS